MAPSVLDGALMSLPHALFDLGEDLLNGLKLGRNPQEISGDAGLATKSNLVALRARRINADLPPGVAS